MKSVIKRNLTVIMSWVWLVLLGGCDSGFIETNTNPVQPTAMNPVYLFSNAQLASSFTTHTMTYEMGIVQQMMNPFAGVNAGGNVNQLNADQAQGGWNNYYNNVVKRLVDVLDKTKDVPERSNLYQMTRIWHSFAFMILSDTYGDVPYTEAGLGYLNGNYFPVYDTQESIYNSILTTLDQAVNALDASKPIETGDLFYSGDIVKWKKLGNSLLLRAAMRLSKVDPSKAEEYTAKAIAGGVMTSNDDNCFMRHSATYESPFNTFLNGSEKVNFYLGGPFVEYLKTTADPRLPVIAVKYENPSLNPGSTPEDREPSRQIGMPYGYDNLSISTAPGFPGTAGAGYKYSQADRATLVKLDAPMFFVTYAQTALLMAEAAYRGWISGDENDLYQTGIEAHFKQLEQYDSDAKVDPVKAVEYLSKATLTAGKELELINTQYWVASFLNGPEAWSNFRRSGFPMLKPNPYPGKSIKGDFIKRLVYPINESVVNRENYNAAVSRLGEDDLDSKVWWDK